MGRDAEQMLLDADRRVECGGDKVGQPPRFIGVERIGERVVGHFAVEFDNVFIQVEQHASMLRCLVPTVRFYEVGGRGHRMPGFHCTKFDDFNAARSLTEDAGTVVRAGE